MGVNDAGMHLINKQMKAYSRMKDQKVKQTRCDKHSVSGRSRNEPMKKGGKGGKGTWGSWRDDLDY